MSRKRNLLRMNEDCQSTITTKNVITCAQIITEQKKNLVSAALEHSSIISAGLDEGQIPVGVFCDLSKAFDLVSHLILIMKLHHYGITRSALDIIKSFLRSRIQAVEVSHNQGKPLSGLQDIKHGVPCHKVLY
ncbi:uncharacterized protein LOC126298008 [Schistocerca gregaria]|uniref:uncharacterized protein LOC126298008 n=1 Tax=Schistocerca gregaria TaxID=7010 RepID=UPI00211EF922|nr:uncharacterized protein LOC126298008 [Schistocerca gregaria]